MNNTNPSTPSNTTKLPKLGQNNTNLPQLSAAAQLQAQLNNNRNNPQFQLMQQMKNSQVPASFQSNFNFQQNYIQQNLIQNHYMLPNAAQNSLHHHQMHHHHQIASHISNANASAAPNQRQTSSDGSEELDVEALDGGDQNTLLSKDSMLSSEAQKSSSENEGRMSKEGSCDEKEIKKKQNCCEGKLEFQTKDFYGMYFII